jgi:hypothetical protein
MKFEPPRSVKPYLGSRPVEPKFSVQRAEGREANRHRAHADLVPVGEWPCNLYSVKEAWPTYAPRRTRWRREGWTKSEPIRGAVMMPRRRDARHGTRAGPTDAARGRRWLGVLDEFRTPCSVPPCPVFTGASSRGPCEPFLNAARIKQPCRSNLGSKTSLESAATVCVVRHYSW